jgi:hypothetical protein
MLENGISKVLVGTCEIGRMVCDMTDGLRRLGYQVDSIVSFPSIFEKSLLYTVSDYSQGQHTLLLDQLIRSPFETFLLKNDALQTLYKLFTDYDLYIFQFGESLLSNNLDLPILKSLGKKIISIFNGDDARHWSAAQPVYEKLGTYLPDLYLEEPKKTNDRAFDRIRRIRWAEAYADLVFSDVNFSSLFIRPYHQRFMPIILENYSFHIPDRAIPLIVHAPSVRGVKGTDKIIK